MPIYYGLFTLPGDATKAMATLGSGTIKARLLTVNTASPWTALSVNTDTSLGTQDDTSKVGWDIILRTDTDTFDVRRKAPTTGTLTVPFEVRGSDGRTVCTLADGSVNRAMTAPAITAGPTAIGTVAASYSSTVYNAWVSVVTVAITTRGSYVLIMLNAMLTYNSLANTGVNVHQRVLRDGSWIGNLQPGNTIGGAGSTPLPTWTVVDGAPAGAHTYDLQIYQASGSSSSITSLGYPNGYIHVWEVG